MKDKNKVKQGKIDKSEYDYFDKKGNLVIKNKIALREIKMGEILYSYGKII
jgi:major membrane immunogen (membrane-anchored lipoprotein)